jgi:membrane protein YdbS with pleckstrin-like domain
MQPQAGVRQERPSAKAIVLERGFDTIIVLASVLAVAVPFYFLSPTVGAIFVFLAFIGAGLIVVRAGFDFVAREYSLYRIEADRLVIERGLVTRRRVVVPLDAGHLQGVFARQSFLGRLGNYGDVIISTAGSGWARLHQVENPYAWQGAILRHVAAPARLSEGVRAPVHVTASAWPLRRLAWALGGFLILVCLASTLFGQVSIRSVQLAPTPTPTPAPSIFSGMNITVGDIFSSMWMLYQIPIIFWVVNLAIILSIATTVMEAAGRRH